MAEPTAAQYDKLFKRQIVKDAAQRKKNQWNRRGFYDIAKGFLPYGQDVFELGCGDGFFTNFLEEGQGYIGIDFSKVLINHGKKLYPNRVFIHADVRDKSVQMLFKDNFTYVCLETLEHIKNDLEVVASLPRGADFIFSVPSRDNSFHVRYFKSFEEIMDRYEDYLTYEEWDEHETSYNNFIRVMKTKRK